MKTATKVAGFTAEGVFVKLSVPEGMDAALQGLTREVLRNQPADIYWFAAQYFERLIRARGGGHVEKVTTWQETRSSKRSSRAESSSSTLVTSRQDGLGSSVASLAATTGTVAVLATASASQPSAPPYEGSSHGEEEHLSKHVSSSQEVSPRDAVQGGSTASKKQRPPKKDKSKKDKGSKSKREGATSSSKSGSSEEISPRGEMTKQVDNIVKGLAHETVLRTEEISKRVSETNSAVDKEATNTVTIKTDGKSGADGKVHSRSTRETRKLKRQTKSVDSNSMSDRSEKDEQRFANTEAVLTAASAIEKMETQVTESHSMHQEIVQENSSKTTEEEAELKLLQEWVDSDLKGTQNLADENKLNIKASDAEKTGTEPRETDYSHYENSFTASSEYVGETPTDIKAEELRILTEGSIRKSSAHDIREETGEDGSHTVTEEKAEETQENKHEASEKTTLERMSNVQVDENGGVIEEEITITRTEQSSKTETTVSKSWTMETTVETLEDGETRVIERMILHSPTENNSEKENTGCVENAELQRQENSDTNIPTEIRQIEENVGTDTTPQILDSIINVGHSIVSEEQNNAKISLADAVVTHNGEDSVSTTVVEERREFGIVDADEANKSLEQISIALEQAEKSLESLQDESSVSEKVKTEKADTTPDDVGAIEVKIEVNKDGKEIAKEEFGLIDAEEAKKSLEQISVALSRAEESLGVLHTDSKSIEITETVDLVSDTLNEKIIENVQGNEEFGLIDTDKAKKSLEQIATALPQDSSQSHVATKVVEHQSVSDNKKDLELSTSQQTAKDHQSQAESMHIQVDEDGKEIAEPELKVVKRTIDDDANPMETVNSGGLHLSEQDKNGLDLITEQTAIVNNIEIKSDDNILPSDATDVERGSDVSKDGSKEETSSEPKGLSSQAPDFPTDEDQETPRDELESLRVDTPDDSSATKSSSGSDENGDPINPPTVVISRTADVIEVKDGEANIVTQMEKEGLVEGIRGDDPVERIFTRGALQTLAEENIEQVVGQKLSPKVAGITVIAATAGFVAVEKESAIIFPDNNIIAENTQEKENDTIEIVAGGFNSHQLIHEEAKHSSWLLESPVFIIPTASLHSEIDSNILIEQGATKPEEEQDPQKEKNDITIDNDSLQHYEKTHTDQTFVAEEKAHSQTDLPAIEDINYKTESPIKPSVLSSVESSAPKESSSSSGPDLDENGKPIPVDENGKPLYTARKKRSIENETNVTIANDIIPDTSKVKVTRTGSIVGTDENTTHWYGSQMSSTGSTVIKPILAMARDPAIAELQPCNEPECVAVDVREKNKDDKVPLDDKQRKEVNVMKEMSQATSRVGQSIISLGSDSRKKSQEVDENGKIQDVPTRSDSQESYIISDDAVYIPLNPSEMKQSSLERIDSVPSVKESAHDQTPPIDKNILIASGADKMDSAYETPLSKAVAHVAVTTSPGTYTITEPKSDLENVKNELENVIRVENQDDDVLIVEYPADADGKITKWDHVVVTSPADIRDARKEEELQPFESMPVESYISMDDSLQEVPSLQDEAVGHLDSESELLDSMPEEDSDRKWTDDVAQVASKAKSMVKGIFRSAGEEMDESALPDHQVVSDLKDAALSNDNVTVESEKKENLEVKSIENLVALDALGALNRSVENIEPVVNQNIKEISDDMDDVLTEEKIVAGNVQSSISSLNDNFDSSVNVVKDAVAQNIQSTEDAFKTVSNAVEENVASFSKDVKDNVLAGVSVAEGEVAKVTEKVNNMPVMGASTVHSFVEESIAEIKDSVKDSASTVTEIGEDLSVTVAQGIDSANSAVDKVQEAISLAGVEVKETGKTVFSTVDSGTKEGLDKVAENVSNVMTDLKVEADSVREKIGQKVDASVSSIKNTSELLVETVENNIEITKEKAESIVQSTSEKVGIATDAVKSGAQSSIAAVKSEVTSASNSLGKAVSDTVSGTGEVASKMGHGVESVVHSVEESVQSVAESVSNTVGDGLAVMKEGVESIQKEATGLSSTVEGKIKSISEGIHNTDSELQEVIDLSTHTVDESTKKVHNDMEQVGSNMLDSTSEKVHNLTSAASNAVEALQAAEENGIQKAELLARRAEEEAESTVHSIVEIARDEEQELHKLVSSSKKSAEAATQLKVDAAADEVVATLKLAEASVEQALNHAEMTIKSEALKGPGIALEDETNLATSASHVFKTAHVAGDNTVETLEQVEESVKKAPNHAEEVISAETQKSLSLLTEVEISESVGTKVTADSHKSSVSAEQQAQDGGEIPASQTMMNDTAVETLERLEESVKEALDRAEETISSRKSPLTITFEGVETKESSSRNEEKIENESSKTEINSALYDARDETVAALERAEESVQMALNRAEETISAESMKALSSLENRVQTHTESSLQETAESMVETVSTASLVQQFSESIHERVRKEVSTLRDETSPRSQEGSVRKGRATSDITSRKGPPKSDSWESNLRRSTVASSGKITRTSTASGSEATSKKTAPSLIPRSTRKAVTSQSEQTTKAASQDVKKRAPLRKAKSLAEDSSEEAKKRVKKMPSQGSTKKTAISVESAVEAAGETVVKRALDKAKSSQEEDTSSDKSTSGTTSSSTRHRRESHSSSSEETQSHTVTTELAHAAATIQDAFRDISAREHQVPVDENGKEMAAAPAPQRSTFQIEPVLEEIAEEVGTERQEGSRRGSRQDSQGADNEDTSTSESSLSSAATRIQAGYRGHLARRHRLHRHSTTGTASMGTASTSISMSMSRDSDVGVVRAMSLLDDSEVQRHQVDPLDQLPEADEFGPAKYVADVHRAQAEAHGDHGGKKGVEWARSLDSGLSSGPERHTPVRTAMSVQQRAHRDRDLDEHIWRTLEQEMLAGEAATDESEGASGGHQGPRRLSTRRGLHRGNAMQLPTTSSSTPPSLDEAPKEQDSARHTGEFHDMLVLPLLTAFGALGGLRGPRDAGGRAGPGRAGPGGARLSLSSVRALPSCQQHSKQQAASPRPIPVASVESGGQTAVLVSSSATRPRIAHTTQERSPRAASACSRDEPGRLLPQRFLLERRARGDRGPAAGGPRQTAGPRRRDDSRVRRSPPPPQPPLRRALSRDHEGGGDGGRHQDPGRLPRLQGAAGVARADERRRPQHQAGR